MTEAPEYGRRLLVTTLDSIAQTEPEKPWISIPKDDNDLSKGFVDLTFSQLSNAINHAASWLDAFLKATDGNFDTFAYEGPSDARLPIITMAAVKSGRKILLTFPLAPPAAKGYLLDVTGCSAFVYAETSEPGAQEILATRVNVRGLKAPPLNSWITETKAEPYPYKKSWDEAKDDPCIIFHSSGTTGLPKPIVYTNRMMTVFDIQAIFPDAGPQTQASCITDRRVYSTIPMNHLVGMVGVLQGSVWLGTTVVIGPSTKPPNPVTSDQVVQYGDVQGLIGPPILIKALARIPHTLERLRSLKFVQWAGAPLEQEIGNLLKDHVRLSPAFGTTEAGPYLTTLTEDPEDWAYYRFRPCQGITFDLVSSTTFELVFRKEASALWQQIFFLYPELTVYQTGDLFRVHPTKKGLFLYVGRADDSVVLANGDCLQASFMEGLVGKDPLIHEALVGGSGAEKPFLLIELTEPTEIEKFWPSVEVANASCSVFARLLKELTIVAKEDRPFVRSAKGTVLRKETFDVYKTEVMSAYDAYYQN